MRRAGYKLALLLGLLSACSPGSVDGEADSGVVDPLDDSGSGELDSGIVLHFVPASPLPVSLSGGEGVAIEITDVDLHVTDLRLIGDVVAGDGPAHLSSFEIEFDREQNSAAFPDVPPGIYSTVRGTLSPSDLDGSIEFSDEGEYEVDLDSSAAAVDFNLSLENAVLPAGEVLAVTIEFDVEAALAGIDWNSLEADGDELEVEGQAFDTLLSNLVGALTVVDISSSDID